jgi:hypothetical protein
MVAAEQFRLQRFVDGGSCNSDETSMDVKQAPTITRSMVVFPVISVTARSRSVPHHPGKKSSHAREREAFRLN